MRETMNSLLQTHTYENVDTMLNAVYGGRVRQLSWSSFSL